MTKKIFLYCLLAALSYPLHSQQNDSLDLDYEFFKRRGVWDMAAGGRVGFFDFDAMNRTLGQVGLPDVESNVSGVAVAFRNGSPASRWATESSLEALWSGQKSGISQNGAAALYRNFAAHVRLMYDISYRNRLTKLFPFIGIGADYQALRTYKGLPGGGSFVLTIAQDVKKNRFNSTSIPLEAGLSLEQGFHTRTYDIFIGVRGGYTYRVLRSDWALDGDIIVDLPLPEAGAPFVMFSVRFKTDPQRAWEKYKKQMRSN